MSSCGRCCGCWCSWHSKWRRSGSNDMYHDLSYDWYTTRLVLFRFSLLPYIYPYVFGYSDINAWRTTAAEARVCASRPADCATELLSHATPQDSDFRYDKEYPSWPSISMLKYPYWHYSSLLLEQALFSWKLKWAFKGLLPRFNPRYFTRVVWKVSDLTMIRDIFS